MRLKHQLLLLLNLDYSNEIENIDICDVLLFCHDVDRPISLSGKAYSPLLDSVREDFESRGLSCKSIAHFGSLLTGKKGYGEPISLNRAYIFYILKRKILNLLGVNSRFKSNPFVDILEKSGAKMILTIGFPAELAIAAKSKGVFHVELLHGIGYAFLPWGWDKLSSDFLPNGILSLDEVSTKSFSPLEDEKVDIHTIPHPFLKRFSPNRLNSQPPEWVIDLSKSSNFSKNILVTLTWGYAGDHGPHVNFADILPNGLFFEELFDLVKEESNVFWHFRMHPVQLRKLRYKKLLDFMDDLVLSQSNVDWRVASSLPFPSIAMHCDGNVSMSSMSCYDAAASGVPSLMLCPTVQKGNVHQDWFVDLENEGYVTKAKFEKEMLRNWVQQTHKVKPKLSNLEDDDAWEVAVKWMLQKSGLEEPAKRKDQR